MPQGWTVNGTADQITFFESPESPGGATGNVWLSMNDLDGSHYLGDYNGTSWAGTTTDIGASLIGSFLRQGNYLYQYNIPASQFWYCSTSNTTDWTMISTTSVSAGGGKIFTDGTYLYLTGGVYAVQRMTLPNGAFSDISGANAFAKGGGMCSHNGALFGTINGDNGVSKSTDAGANWTYAVGTLSFTPTSSPNWFVSNGPRLIAAYVKVADNHCVIEYSDDDGVTWSGVVYTFPSPYTADFLAVDGGVIHDGTHFVSVLNNGKTAYSADGISWVAGATIPRNVRYLSVGIGKIIASTYYTENYYSDDHGATWTLFDAPVGTGVSTDSLWTYWIGDLSATITVKEYAAGAYGGSTSIWALGAWSDHFGFPHEVEYYGDRMFFANTRTQPQTLWGSRVSGYSDFGKSSPIQDDDAFAATLNARQVNEIRDLVPLDAMLCMTTGGEWKVTGGAENVLTPASTGFQPQSYRGVSNVQGVVVGNSALFIQDRGSVVRDMAWKFDSDGYDGNDLSIFAAHLIDGYTLVDMAYQQYPNSVVWLVRSDGALLGVTYVREQEVVGWHRHDTDGFVENVCCVPEYGGDVLYVCVRRVINGQTKRYIERLETREVFDQEDCFFVDCGLSYDGRNASATTLTVTGGTLWDETENLTVTASAALFTFTSGTGDSTWISDHIKIGSTRFMIIDWTSTTVVTVRVIGTVPAAIRAVASTDFVLMRDRITGLGHLEGKTVAVLSDGNEEAQKVVTSGTITLDRPGGVVHVGLPYVSDFETLEVNSIGAETIRDRKKTIPSVTVLVDKSAGVFAGPDFDHLEMHRPRDAEAYDLPTPLLTGAAMIQVTTRWEESGRLCIRQTAPLPLSILGVIPELKVAG